MLEQDSKAIPILRRIFRLGTERDKGIDPLEGGKYLKIEIRFLYCSKSLFY